jgi:hypothetical protein
VFVQHERFASAVLRFHVCVKQITVEGQRTLKGQSDSYYRTRLNVNFLSFLQK